jgi:methionyl aminopeptidase
MIELRTPGELDAMRAAGAVVADMLAAVRATAAPGVRLTQLDAVARDVLADAWAGYAAITFPVGTPRAEDLQLVATAQRALEAGIAAAVVGNRVGDISAAIGAVGRAGGCGINTDQGGHGVGRTMHEAPHVPNEGRAGRGVPLRAGLVIAIEPWFLAGGSDDYRVDADGWTLRSADGSRAAHVEHTVAVTDDGPRILTLPR